MAKSLKKDDLVVVIAGRDKGRKGRVLRADPETDRVIVEGINVVKRHTRATPQSPEGGILEKAMPIHRSNLMLWEETSGVPSRSGFRLDDDGVKRRFYKRGGANVAE
jgi:large subunit ribosomal protein L24